MTVESAVVNERLALALIAVVAMSCAHTPTSPTAAVPLKLTVTTMSGEILETREVQEGQITVTRPGYLTRTLYIGNKSRTDALWENDAFLPYDTTTFPLAYGSQGYFFRPRPGVMTVALDRWLLQDYRSRQALAAAVATINAIDPRLQFQIVGSNADVQVLLEPQQAFGGALTWFDVFDSEGYLLKARITFQGTAGFYGNYLQSALTHELGHVWGLQDVPASSTVWMMDTAFHSSGGPSLDFSPQEKAVMRAMLFRKPGNAPPDAEKP